MSDKATLNFIQRALAPMARRVFSLVGRAVIDSVSDAEKIQLLKVSLLAGEVKEGVERFQNFGFTSVPLPEAEAVALFPGGNRDHGIIICVDDRRFRLSGLPAGSAAMYDSLGQKIVLKNGIIAEIECVELKVTAAIKATVEAPLVDLGKVGLQSVINGQSFQAYFNQHIHSVAGITSTPPLVPSTPDHLSLQVKAGI